MLFKKEDCILSAELQKFANFFNMKANIISYVLYVKRTENCYTAFEILKKYKKETRIIHAPNKTLKKHSKKYCKKTTRTTIRY